MEAAPILRNGFISSYGHFDVVEVPNPDPNYNGGPETPRMESSRLKELFLPRLTTEGRKIIKDNVHFVRAQFKHYDVDFSEWDFDGHGTKLLQKKLKAGEVNQPALFSFSSPTHLPTYLPTVPTHFFIIDKITNKTLSTT